VPLVAVVLTAKRLTLYIFIKKRDRERERQGKNPKGLAGWHAVPAGMQA
jgi:hypothetical protein